MCLTREFNNNGFRHEGSNNLIRNSCLYKRRKPASYVIRFVSHLSKVGCSPASSTSKTNRHDMTEILLKVALTPNQTTHKQNEKKVD